MFFRNLLNNNVIAQSGVRHLDDVYDGYRPRLWWKSVHLLCAGERTRPYEKRHENKDCFANLRHTGLPLLVDLKPLRPSQYSSLRNMFGFQILILTSKFLTGGK